MCTHSHADSDMEGIDSMPDHPTSSFFSVQSHDASLLGPNDRITMHPDYTPPFSSDANMLFSGGVAGSHGPSGLLSSEADAHGNLLRRLRRNDLGESQVLSMASQSLQHTPRLDANGNAVGGNATEAASNFAPSAHETAHGGSLAADQRIKVIWGTNIVVRDCVLAFREFLAGFTPGHRKIADGQALGDADVDTQPVYPQLLEQIHISESYILNVDMLNLKSFQSTKSLYHQLLKFPQEIIPIMDIVVNEYYYERYPDVDPAAVTPIQVRPFNCGKTVNMRALNPADIDQLVAVKGLVIRTSNVIPDMKIAFFKCAMCDFSVSVENVKGKITPPSRCPRDECRANQAMDIIHNRCVFNSKQVVRVQETPDAIPDGQTPHTVSMCVYDCLVDFARPGDKVEVTGIYRAAPVKVSARTRKIKTQFRTFIDVVHIRRSSCERLTMALPDETPVDAMLEEDAVSGASAAHQNEDDVLHVQDDERIKATVERLAADPNLYERLAKSIAPSIYGLDNVKKSLLLQLLGGVTKTITNGAGSSRLRGDINILLAGDPGVSKSQLLQYIHKLAPRGVYTSGKGSSAVGLTAYITRDPESKQLVLESGALVLSDGGICCIDEFDKMSDSTRAILHEVMEQQTISVAKAGIITTLNARSSILASANPVDSKYNPRKSIVDNLNLPPTLLSRFDIICLLMDNPDEENDRRIAKHIVSLYCDRSAQNASDAAPNSNETVIIDTKTLTEFISYCRKLEPVLSDAATKELISGYLHLRKVNGGGSGKTVSATVRQLESLIRLSEAHAKMRVSATVDSVDVAEAIRLMREALLSYAIDPLTGKIDMDLVYTGRSSAVREQLAELKRSVKSFFANVNSSIDFMHLSKELAAQKDTQPFINEKLLREALAELAEEEFLLVVGNASLKSGNPLVRKLI